MFHFFGFLDYNWHSLVPCNKAVHTILCPEHHELESDGFLSVDLQYF